LDPNGPCSLGHYPYADEIPLDTALIDRRAQAVMALQNYLGRRIFQPRSGFFRKRQCRHRPIRQMAKTSSSELAKSIKFEAEPYIPFNIEEVNLSFSILGETSENDQTQMETVLVAAKKDAVDLRMNPPRSGARACHLDVDASLSKMPTNPSIPPPNPKPCCS